MTPRHLPAAPRGVPPRGLLIVAAAGTGLAAACLPAPVTAEARSIADLYGTFVAIAIVVATVVYVSTTFTVLRYRRPHDGTLPPQTHGNLVVEAIWTGIPVIIILALFAFTLVVLGSVERRTAQPTASVRVEAFRWGWTFSYPDEGVTVSGIGQPGPEAVLPVGEPVRVTLVGNDVIHAFFVPQFLFKRDIVPGRESVFEFTIDEPGMYRGQCAEFCGLLHARMPFTLRAVPAADYAAWLELMRGEARSPVPLQSLPAGS